MLTCPESAGHAQLRTSTDEFGYLAKSGLNTGYEPKEFDEIISVGCDAMLIDDPDLNGISDFTKSTPENSVLCGVLTMFESSVSNVSHDDFALPMDNEESMHQKKQLLDREKQKKEKVL